MTDVGPVEVVVVGFPGSKFSGKIIPELQAVVERGDVRIIDLAVVAKDTEGNVAILEVDDGQDDGLSMLAEAIEEVLGLLNEEDLNKIADAIEPGSAAAAVVFEHVWAKQLANAVDGAEGEVIFSERIPRDVVLAAVEAAKA